MTRWSESAPILPRSEDPQHQNIAGRFAETGVGDHTIQRPVAGVTREFSNPRVLAGWMEAGV